MLQHPILDRLYAMRFAGMAKSVVDRVANAEGERLSHPNCCNAPRPRMELPQRSRAERAGGILVPRLPIMQRRLTEQPDDLERAS